MRYFVMAALLALTACGEGPVTKANAAYAACIDARGVEGCQNEKANLDAALAVADAQSRRNASHPVILRGPTIAPQPQPLNCITTGNVTTCY